MIPLEAPPNTISIRSLRLEYATDVYRAVTESRNEIGRWMDWCHPGYALDDAEKWIRAVSKARNEGLAYEFGIFGDGRFLGGIGISQINRQAKHANLGYWLRTSATGRGITTAAVKLTAKWAFDNTDLERLEIVVAVENHASRRVAEKAGAVREGTLRSKICVFGHFFDAVMYSIVRGDPGPF